MGITCRGFTVRLRIIAASDYVGILGGETDGITFVCVASNVTVLNFSVQTFCTDKSSEFGFTEVAV